jgi:glycosyltransferase involved in cell wall biosynthesis
MPNPLRISVALCTCNGEQFLQEQLQSILAQTRMPDELIAFDDVSADRTVEMLQTFAGSAPFPVRIQQNQVRLGPAQNFAAAIAACTCEIICLGDQDDIWDPARLSLAEATFNRTPRPAFVFSDADICDRDGRLLGYRLWDSVGFTPALRHRFSTGQGLDVLLRQNIVTGATLSFLSEFRPLILPIDQRWMHDGWIALLLSAVAGGVALDQPLVRYRQHPAQAVGAEWRSLYQQYQNARKMNRTVFDEQADQYDAALERLQEDTNFDVRPHAVRLLQEKIRHSRRRAAIRQRKVGRVIPSITEFLTRRYTRFSLGWKSLAQDLFL